MVATGDESGRAYDLARHVFSAPTVGGVFISSRNGSPSRKGCVVNGRMTKMEAAKGDAPPPPACSVPAL